MAKHTPGPWTLPHFAQPDVNCECRYVLCDHLMGAVATVHCSGDGDDWISHGDNPRYEQAVANARLIAAAPELLEALQAVVRVADRKTDEFDMARAAIAKAEGHSCCASSPTTAKLSPSCSTSPRTSRSSSRRASLRSLPPSTRWMTPTIKFCARVRQARRHPPLPIHARGA